MANKLWSSVNRGTYSGSTQYYVGDFVNYNGSYYTCIQNSLGNLPTDTSYWALVASKGDTGATGPQGPQGPPGADGLDITWRGEYNNSTSYNVNDAVSYNGSSYICKLATTGNPPTNTTYWDLMAQKGQDGTGIGDVVGPSSSTNNNIVLFDGTTGKLIKDGGKGLPSGAVVGDTDTQTLSNKTLDNTNILTIKDANLTIQDDVDTTKQAKFQASGITAGQTRTYTLPDANTTLVGTDNPQTITNKRNQKRTSSTTSASSLTPDISQYDLYQFTALASNLTINNPTGTPVLGEIIVILIKDNGTSRTLSFGTAYKAMGQALPTATTAGKRMEIICEYDGTDWLTSYVNEQ